MEFVVLLAGIVAAGSVQHYTWWGCAILLAADFVELFSQVVTSQQPIIDRVWMLLLVNSVYIQLAVLCMSAAKCTYFNDVRLELGNTLYLIGNFIVHYLPSLRALSMLHRAPRRFHTLHLDATLLSVVFCTIYNPRVQYGCEDAPNLLLLTGSTIAPIAIELIIVRYSRLLFTN